MTGKGSDDQASTQDELVRSPCYWKGKLMNLIGSSSTRQVSFASVRLGLATAWKKNDQLL